MKRLMLVAALILAPTCQISDVATPMEATRLEQLWDQHAAAVHVGDADLVASLQAEIDAMDRTIAERVVGGVLDLVPLPLKVFTPLLATLFFKRVRRTAVKSLKSTLDVAKKTVTGDFKGAGTAIGDAVDSALSIVGLIDSREDTAVDMQMRADTLRAEGNETAAAALEEQIPTI